MLLEIEHKELSDKVYEIMKEKILRREFKGGDKLDLNVLSEQMKISRTPLKDAITRLAAERLVEVKPRSGTFVSRVTSQDIEQIMDIRLMIELWALSRLNPDSCAELYAHLEQILKQSQQIIDDGPFSIVKFLECDAEFHRTIVKFSGNPRLVEMYDAVNCFIQITRIFYYRNAEDAVSSHRFHSNVAKFIGENNLPEALKRLEAHLTDSREKMVNILNDIGGYV
jgi:Transcriptional regulators